MATVMLMLPLKVRTGLSECIQRCLNDMESACNSQMHVSRLRNSFQPYGLVVCRDINPFLSLTRTDKKSEKQSTKAKKGEEERSTESTAEDKTLATPEQADAHTSGEQCPAPAEEEIKVCLTSCFRWVMSRLLLFHASHLPTCLLSQGCWLPKLGC
jgi:hypothetical protein